MIKPMENVFNRIDLPDDFMDALDVYCLYMNCVPSNSCMVEISIHNLGEGKFLDCEKRMYEMCIKYNMPENFLIYYWW